MIRIIAEIIIFLFSMVIGYNVAKLIYILVTGSVIG